MADVIRNSVARMRAMKEVCVIGGGFGGLAAARQLAPARDVRVTLIDARDSSDFLPLLPDVVGGRVTPAATAAPLPDLTRRLGIGFQRERVVELELSRNKVTTPGGSREYDAILIAAGSGPNFYGDAKAERFALPLGNCAGAARIVATLKETVAANLLVVGGGYTGIEIATNLRVRLRALPDVKIAIIEASGSLLNGLPEWMRRYAEDNLERLGIRILKSCRLADLDASGASLTNGETLRPALTMWSAGVRAAGFVRNLDVEKDSYGRAKVDETLRIAGNVFAVGDSACVMHGGKPLRMAVQFAISQGRCAADNALRALAGRPLLPYRPLDLGFIIPMANGRSCGRVLGVNVRGRPASWLHYFMCAYRSQTLHNKLGVLHALAGRRA